MNDFQNFPALHTQREAGKRDRLYIIWPAELSGTGKRRKEYFGPAEDPASRARYAAAREEWLNAREKTPAKLAALPPEGAEPAGEIRPANAADDEDETPVGLVANLIDRYLVHTRQRYQKHGKPTGTHRHIWITLKPFLLKYGEMETAKFGLDELEEYQQELDRAGRLCRNKINARIRIICACFTWGARHKGEDGQRLVPPAIAAELKMIENLRRGYCRAIDHPRRLAAPIEHIEAVIKKLAGPVRAMVRVQLLTGARPGEVRLMKAKEITRAGEVWEYRPESYKTEHFERDSAERKVIFLGPQAIAEIEPFMDAAEKDAASGGEGYLFSPLDSAKERRAISKTVKKTPSRRARDAQRARKPLRGYADHYSGPAYNRALHRAAERASVPPFTPYQIRKARATEIDRLYGEQAAAIQLGHRNVRTTVDHYIDPRTEQARELAKKIG